MPTANKHYVGINKMYNIIMFISIILKTLPTLKIK